MANDYEPNASGLINTTSAMGAMDKSDQSMSGAFSTGQQQTDMGEQIKQQIARTQAMQSDLQTKIVKNHADMTNHLTQRMASLAGMNDDDKKGPMWDMQVDALHKDINTIGLPITPDSLDNMLSDPNYSSRLAAALNATAMAGLDPVKQAAVVQKNAAMLGRPDLVQNFPEEVQKELQTQMQMSYKMQNQDIKKQSIVGNFVNRTQQVQKDFNKNIEYAGNIQNLLKPGVPYQTGMPQVVAMDELTKLATNTVVRQFTYDNLKGTINAPDKFLQAMDRQLNSGKPLNEQQVKDVSLVAKTLEKGANQLRLKMLAGNHNQAKGMINNAGYAGFEDQLRGAFDPEDWNALEDMSKKNSFNSSTQTYEKQDDSGSSSKPSPKQSPPKAPEFQPYKQGDKNVDSFVQNMISNKASFEQVNKILARKKLKMSKSDYDGLVGK